MENTEQELIFDESGDHAHQFARLVAIMTRLRDPQTGCPWDLEQNYASIASCTIEEAHEVADAIERQAWNELPAELGDLALQIVFHAQMAREDGKFDIVDVLRAINAKMVSRHPHVFGNESRDKTSEQQIADWEAIKAAERAAAGKSGRVGVLDGVTLGLPALTRAIKLQDRAARVGFDWPSADAVLGKITEEAAELIEARDNPGLGELAGEYGDLLFVMVNLGRHLGLDPEAALRAANGKFILRFNHIEAELHARGKSPKDSDPTEMNALWDDAKAKGIK